MSLIIAARHHMDTIQSHPARIRLRDYGVLDFDAVDARRQPPVDKSWQQIYFCLGSGYYEEVRNVALSSRASHQFAPLVQTLVAAYFPGFTEWISAGCMVPTEFAIAALEERVKMLRTGDHVGRTAYDKKKLLLYAITRV